MNLDRERPDADFPFSACSISYNFTREDLFIGFLLTPLRNRVLQVFIIGWVAVCEIVLILSSRRSIYETIFYAVLYLGVVVGGTMVGLVIISATLAFVPRQRGVVGLHELKISDEGLVEHTEYNESLHRWPMINRAVSIGGHLFVYVNPTSYHQIPRRRLDKEKLTSFEADLRSRIRANRQ